MLGHGPQTFFYGKWPQPLFCAGSRAVSEKKKN